MSADKMNFMYFLAIMLFSEKLIFEKHRYIIQ